MIMCLSKSQEDDIMMMCLSKSQASWYHDDVSVEITRGRYHDDVSVEITRGWYHDDVSVEITRWCSWWCVGWNHQGPLEYRRVPHESPWRPREYPSSNHRVSQSPRTDSPDENVCQVVLKDVAPSRVKGPQSCDSFLGPVYSLNRLMSKSQKG